jgi:hypothetical protein
MPNSSEPLIDRAKREQSKRTQEMSEFLRAGQWSFGYVRNKEKEARRRQRRGLIER